MTKLLLGRNDIVLPFVSGIMRDRVWFEPDKCTTIGLVQDSVLVCGVVYSLLGDEGHVCASIAANSPRWATRGNIRTIFHYPFVQLNARRITALVHKKNKRSRKLLNGLGFHVDGCLPKGYPNGDMIIYGITRQQAGKWLGE